MKNLKTIDVLKTGSINSPIGPTGTLRRFIKHRNYLLERGYDLNVFTKESFSEVHNQQKKNTNQNRKTFKSKIKHFIKSKLEKSKLLSTLHILKMIYDARKFAKKYCALNRNPDVIVFHDYFVYDQFFRISDNDKVKKILFFHNDGIKFELIYKTFPKLRNTYFFNYLENRFDDIVPRLDKLVFISSIALKNFKKNNNDVNQEKFIFFHNGIENSSYSLQDVNEVFNDERANFKYRFCCTGSINQRKGQFLIVEALNKIDKKTLSNICVTFLGKGAQYQFLQETSKKYSINDHVYFEGIVDNSKVKNYLRKSNIYILMSNNEGLPISIIEAMREGLPIISTKVAGIPEQVEDGFNGRLIEPSVDELVNVLENLDKYNWENMGMNSRNKFETEFTFEQMKKAYCDMLDSLFNNDNKRL